MVPNQLAIRSKNPEFSDCYSEIVQREVVIRELVKPNLNGLDLLNTNDCATGNIQGSIQVSGNIENFQYRLNNGNWQASNQFTDLAAGNHRFQVQTVGNTCSQLIATLEENLSEAESAVIDSLQLANVTDCNLGNAQITVVLAQGSGVQFRLNGGNWQFSPVFSNLGTGSYTIEAQPHSNSECRVSTTTYLQESIGPKITGHTSNEGYCGGATGAFTVTLQTNSNAAGIEFQRGNGPWQSSPTFGGLVPGSHSFKIRSSNTCGSGSSSESYSLTINGDRQPTITTVTQEQTEDCVLNNVVLRVNLAESSSNFRFRNNSGPWQSSPSFTGLTSGVYRLDVGVANNLSCFASITVNVTESGKFQLTGSNLQNLTDCTPGNVVLNVLHNGSGQAALEFQIPGKRPWQTEASFAGLGSGSYTIAGRVKSATCLYPISTLNVNINETEHPFIQGDSIVGISDCTSGNARVFLKPWNSNLAARYRLANTTSWQTSPEFRNLSSGTYTFETAATTSTNCINRYTLTVDEKLGRIDSLTVINPDDCVNRNAQIVVNHSGTPQSNIRFSINNGAYQPQPNFTGLSTGTYQIRSLTSNNCTSSSTVAITESLVPEITGFQILTGKDDCVQRNMTARVEFSNPGLTLGTVRYSINGGPTQNSRDFSGLESGQYLVNASAPGARCFMSLQTTLTEHLPVKIQTVSFEKESDCILGNAEVVANLNQVDGSNLRYQLNSLPFQVGNPRFTNLSAGPHRLEVQDTRTCKDVFNFDLSENSPPIALIAGPDSICAGEELTLSASGGNTYGWSNGSTASSITLIPTQSGSYSVTVTANGCSAIATKEVVVRPHINLSYSLVGSTDCTPNNVEVIPNPSGGSGEITFGIIRSGETSFDSNLNDLGTGNYLLRALDEAGCVELKELEVRERPVSISGLNLSGLNDCIPGNTQLEIEAQGDHLPFIYRLNGTELGSKKTILPRIAGQYTIEVEDGEGCKMNIEDYFDDYDALQILDDNIIHVSDCSTPNGGIQLTPILKTGDSKDYSLSVDGGANWHNATNLVLNLPPGKYPTSARNNLTGCTIQGPEVQIEAPHCLPTAGFTQRVLHIKTNTQRISLPWKIDKRPWGNADKPFSLKVYRVGDGKLKYSPKTGQVNKL